MVTALVNYETARLALINAVKFDEVMAIKNTAEQASLYARQAQDSELIERATEIKVRAERKAGQMLVLAKANGDLSSRGGDRKSKTMPSSLILGDINVSKDQSLRWQKLAVVPDEQFEAAVAAAKGVAGKVVTASILRATSPPAHTKPSKEESLVSEPIKDGSPPKTVVTSEQEGCDDRDMMIDALNSVVGHLTSENERLKNSLATGLVSDEDRAEIAARLATLTEENRKLEMLNKGMAASRDSHMHENASLKKQCAMYQRKIKTLEKNA